MLLRRTRAHVSPNSTFLFFVKEEGATCRKGQVELAHSHTWNLVPLSNRGPCEFYKPSPPQGQSGHTTPGLLAQLTRVEQVRIVEPVRPIPAPKDDNLPRPVFSLLWVLKKCHSGVPGPRAGASHRGHIPPTEFRCRRGCTLAVCCTPFR